MVFLDLEDAQQYLVGQLTSAPYDIAAADDDEEPLVHLIVFQRNGTAVRAYLDKHDEDCDDLGALAGVVLTEVATSWALFAMRRPRPV
jgi:hypothetical protein